MNFFVDSARMIYQTSTAAISWTLKTILGFIMARSWKDWLFYFVCMLLNHLVLELRSLFNNMIGDGLFFVFNIVSIPFFVFVYAVTWKCFINLHQNIESKKKGQWSDSCVICGEKTHLIFVACVPFQCRDGVHIYHEECLDKYLTGCGRPKERKATCRTCRAPMRDDFRM